MIENKDGELTHLRKTLDNNLNKMIYLILILTTIQIPPHIPFKFDFPEDKDVPHGMDPLPPRLGYTVENWVNSKYVGTELSSCLE